MEISFLPLEVIQVRPTDFAYILSKFFADHLIERRNLSEHTISSYSGTFSLFLSFCADNLGIAPEKFSIKNFTFANVDKFLTWLQKERQASIATRNQRLAAIHTFVKYLQFEYPDKILECQRILSIPFKKKGKPLVTHMSDDDLSHILGAPDMSTSLGRRDAVLLSLLYDTGTRVHELLNLTPSDIRLGNPPTVMILGKGGRERHVPLMTQTKKLLKAYMSEHSLDLPRSIHYPLFMNRQGGKLTRAGVSYIIKKYTSGENVSGKKITPHIFRHTKAMHLRRAGINMLYIRDFLGHSELSTTEIYARADAEDSREALELVSPDAFPDELPLWVKDKALLEWLKDLRK